MKKRIAFLVLFCLMLQFSKAQVNTFDVQLPHFLDFGVDPYHTLQQTADKGYIVSRASTDSSYYTTFMHYNEIIKMNKAGKITWTKRLVTGKLDSTHAEKINANPVIQTSDGNFLIGTVMYDSLKLPQACLIKLDKQGDLIWAKKYIAKDLGVIYNLKETGDKNIIACGYTADEANGRAYAMAFKTNANGELNWKFRNVTSDSISGAFYCATEIPGKGYVFAGSINHSSVMVHTGTDGTVLWTRRFFNNIGLNFIRSLIFTNDNSLLVTGWMDGNTSYSQLFFSKFDLNGTIKWAKQLFISGIYNGSFGSDVKEKNNTYYFTGYLSNPIPSTLLGAITSTGDVKWSKQFYNTFHTFNYTPSTLDLTKDNGFVFTSEVGISNGRFATAIVKTDSMGIVSCDNRDYPLKLDTLTIRSLDDVATSDFTLIQKNSTVKIQDIKIRSIVSCELIGDPDVGIETVHEDKRFTVYPNPTTGIITMNSSEAIAHVEIYNYLGSLVYTAEMKQHLSIDLSNLCPGVYIAKVLNANGIIEEQKIIKQ